MPQAVRSSGKHVIRGFGLQWGAEGAGGCALLAAGRGAAVSVCGLRRKKRDSDTKPASYLIFGIGF